MKAIFVAGTDTGAGKTVITGCLARYLSQGGYCVTTQKWILTGSKKSASLLRPYIFKTPCSPHLAAKIENKKINANKIIKSFKLLAKEHDFVIVEGIGGVLVPFSKKELVIDIVKRLNLPVLLVAENRLGAINHTLLTIEALDSRKIKTLGIIFNNLKAEDKQVLEDNPNIIKALTGKRIFGILSREPTYKKIYERFVPIGDRIFKLIRNG